MNRKVILGGTVALVIAVAVAGAQMFPRADNAVPADIVTDPNDNPFAGLDAIFNEEGEDLGLTEEELQAEEDYLRISPPADNGAADAVLYQGENVPYSSCEKEPETLTSEFRRGSAESAAVRDIYAYLRYKRVLELADCTCNGKVAPFSEVQAVKDQLVADHGEDWPRNFWGAHYRREAFRLATEVETFCGGRF